MSIGSKDLGKITLALDQVNHQAEYSHCFSPFASRLRYIWLPWKPKSAFLEDNSGTATSDSPSQEIVGARLRLPRLLSLRLPDL